MSRLQACNKRNCDRIAGNFRMVEIFVYFEHHTKIKTYENFIAHAILSICFTSLC